MKRSVTLALAGLTVLASAAAATAAEQMPVQADQFYSLYQAPDTTSAASDIARYDHSGSRGRLDLGASPRHPEGPGNFSD